MYFLWDIMVSLVKMSESQSTGLHEEKFCDMKCKYYSIWFALFWFSIILYYGVDSYIELMAKKSNLRSISNRFKRLYVYLVEEEYTKV